MTIKSKSLVMETYSSVNLTFKKGEGSWLFATNGQKYLDFSSGIAVTSIGHCHPHLVKAIKKQVEKLIHTSNLYKIGQQEKLAKRLCDISFADSVFFANSGAEANEGAVKIARRYMYEIGEERRNKIVCVEGGFHGRTIAMLAATSKKENRLGFGPIPRGFVHINTSDISLLEKKLDNNVAAIMIEPVQGEGGVKKIPLNFLNAIQSIAEKNNYLIISDEVQTGMGRLGRLFGYENSPLKPDIMALAKGLGGGVPVGAVLASKKVSSKIKPGSHGSTFGGNPLSMAAANAVLDIILKPGFIKSVNEKGNYLFSLLKKIQNKNSHIIEEVRGEGLLLGIKVKSNPLKIVEMLRKENVLTVPAAENVIRFIPPLTVSFKEIDIAVSALNKTINNYKV
tara:strand:+ start:4564 stop:5748 length:1185 start_codon:yes stop_codon:yes gene_type:complete